MTEEIAQCRAEQVRCRDEWRPDHPERRGIELGMTDWLAEELLIEFGLASDCALCA